MIRSTGISWCIFLSEGISRCPFRGSFCFIQSIKSWAPRIDWWTTSSNGFSISPSIAWYTYSRYCRRPLLYSQWSCHGILLAYPANNINLNDLPSFLKAKKSGSEPIAGMFMKPDRLAILQRCRPSSSMTKWFQKSAKKILKSAGSIDSDTAPAILRIRASSDQKSLCPRITSGLYIYFIQSMKKSPNRTRAWMGCIRWSACLKFYKFRKEQLLA